MKEPFLTLYGVYVGKELCSIHFSKQSALMLKSTFKKAVSVKIRPLNAGRVALFLLEDFTKSC